MIDIASIIGASNLDESASEFNAINSARTDTVDSTSLINRVQNGDQQAAAMLDALTTALRSTARSFNTCAGTSPGMPTDQESARQKSA